MERLHLDSFSFDSISSDLFLQISLCLIKFVAQRAPDMNESKAD